MGGLFNRLAVQAALAATAILAAVGILLAVQVGGTVGRNEEAHYRERVERARGLLQEQLASFVDLTETGAVVLASSPELRDAVAKRDVVAALRATTTFSAIAGTPFEGAPGMQIYDPGGALLVRAHAPLNSRQQAVPPEVARVLRERQPLGGVRQDELLGLVQTGVAPINAPDGSLAGAIEVMSTIDSNFTMERAKALGLRVAVLDTSGVIGSSEAELNLRIEALPAALAEQDAHGAAEIKIGQRPFLAAFVPLVSQSGATIGHLYVGVEKSVVDTAVNEARFGLFRTLAFGISIAIAAAWGGSVLAVRPIQALAKSARRIQANDLESAVPVSGPAEIRELGEALDDMRLAFRESREAIVLAGRDLAMQFNVSTASLTEVTHELSVIQSVLAHLSGERSGGLAGAAEELSELSWIHGVFIAVATETGDLSVAALANLTPAAAAAALDLARQQLDDHISDEFEVADAASSPDTALLTGWGIGGMFATPLLTPEGVAGLVAVTATGSLTLTEQRRNLVRSVTREVGATLERTELQSEVDENRRIAEAVLREMADGVLVIDQEGICRIANPGASRLLGRARASLVGQPWGAFLPLDPETMEALRRRAYQPSGQPTAPVLLALHDRQIAITSGAFPDPDPARSGMLVLLRDLSAEADAERVKQDFVSMIGHELRTPLTLIRTTIDLLFEGDAGALNPTQGRIVEVLRNNTDRLMALITDLLDMSSLDSGRMQINPQLVQAGTVIAGGLDNVQLAARAKQHSVRVETPSELTIWADPARIQQVLDNLVSNAIKYTPVGGVIEIHAREASSDFVEISVRDNGIGIPPEEQAHLFEKFYRTTKGRRTTGGTGLGLAIARSIVELHGGQIWCESDGQSGSRFAFTLPRRRV